MNEVEHIVVGCRVPRSFFVATGTGQSDYDIHAGSYHLALRAAGVENYNHMKYSSILPGIAREVAQPKKYTHGAVLETIAAQCDSTAGEIATAGIIYSWLLDPKTDLRYGGLVCERAAHLPEEEVKALLETSLQEIYEDGYTQRYVLGEPHFITSSFTPEKKHGTALALIGFVDYVVQLIRNVRAASGRIPDGRR